MIKQSVINSFKRVGIPWERLQAETEQVEVTNRFGGGSCVTSKLVSYLISWIYKTSNAYEMGDRSVTVSDFDRIRYYVLSVDSNAYYTCID